MTAAVQDGAIEFAEKVLELLDEGRYTATYKFSVLLALIDLCLEHTERSGAPPDLVTTRQLADKLVELYWPHTNAFAGSASALVSSRTQSARPRSFPQSCDSGRNIRLTLAFRVGSPE